MQNIQRYSIIFLLFIGLVLIRAFETDLFYDPFLEFFKNDYLFLDAPVFDTLKLMAFTSLRYLINTILSLGIIYFAFKNVGALKFSAVFYAVAYVILILIFLFLVLHAKQNNYFFLFNIRRFLIQPLLLLLLLPAFYYQKHIKN
ncbi:exosortase F system-associated membrane protein [Formosa algae]|uniref:Exosortase F-associated protein n=1 Tax=Formosa algae TaxID=225843 RepID=A0A9X1CAK4_9FLAO|nr:exosortase F system-associated protein [Formosa algae]MBP1838189.1 exosortase F-associated protein [Formosa algae]MDQ0334324.1 exosortase F-associated protein [Formosa algae]OEI80727.1 exosortase F system-associated protein [Formosa algae]